MTPHISAGVYFEELDYSLYAPQLSKTSPAIIGIFDKGPVAPTLITSARQFIEVFGAPKLGYNSAYACLSYLEFGTNLWVQRLVGPNAKKSSVDLPMGKMVSNEVVGEPNGYDYIIEAQLNEVSIPNTVNIKIGDYNIYDDGYGNLLGSGVINYPQFIDYDTGSYNFTFDTAPSENARIRMRYNKRENNVKDITIALGKGAFPTDFDLGIVKSTTASPTTFIHPVPSFANTLNVGTPSLDLSSFNVTVANSTENSWTGTIVDVPINEDATFAITITDSDPTTIVVAPVEILTIDTTVPVDPSNPYLRTLKGNDPTNPASGTIDLVSGNFNIVSGYTAGGYTPGSSITFAFNCYGATSGTSYSLDLKSGIWNNTIKDGTVIFKYDYFGTNYTHMMPSPDPITGISTLVTPLVNATLDLNSFSLAMLDLQFTSSPTMTTPITVDYEYFTHSTTITGSVADITHLPIKGTTFNATDGVENFVDDGAGNMIGSNGGNGTVDYVTGNYTLNFNILSVADINVNYEYFDHTADVTFNIPDMDNYMSNTLTVSDAMNVEVFTESAGILTSTLGGTGTLDYTTGDVTLTFNSIFITDVSASIKKVVEANSQFTGQLIHSNIKPGTVLISTGVNVVGGVDTRESFRDLDADGILVSSLSSGLSGTIDYKTGIYSIDLVNIPTLNEPIKATYTYITQRDRILNFAVLYDEENFDVNKAFIGALNTRIIPKTVEIYWELPVNYTSEVLSNVGNGMDVTFTGKLPHENVGKVIITDGVETFTDDDNGNLVGSQSGTGKINYNTGDYEITFNMPPINGASIIAESYNTYTANEDTDLKIYDTFGDGMLVGNIVECDNEIDYTTGHFKVAFVNPPNTVTKEGEPSTFSATYTSKYSDIIEYGNGVSYMYEETLPGAPLTAGSVVIMINGEEILKDDGDGHLLSIDTLNVRGNGTVEYDTGYITMNFYEVPVDQAIIKATYLQKFGTVWGISEGEWTNGTTVQVTYDKDNGHGLKVWAPEQTLKTYPIEDWVQVVWDDLTQPNYFDVRIASRYVTIEANTQVIGEIPIIGTYHTLSGGTSDIQGIDRSHAIQAIDIFSDYERRDINLIMVPDFPGDKTVASKLIEMCEYRYDCFCLIDPPANLTPQQVVDWTNGDGQWSAENALNSSFGALYYPWVKIYDPFSKRNVWVPPSVKIVSVYTYSDNNSEPWFAPAGLNRGRIFDAQGIQIVQPYEINVGARDFMYGENNVNPIIDHPVDGVVVWGQKTLQRKTSAFDRVNVRRLLIQISKILATSVKYLVFEPNDSTTWRQYVRLVRPVLEDIQIRRGLYDFGIRCDDTTNQPLNIDRGELVAEIWLQPIKSAEKIITRFLVTATGVELSEIVVNEGLR